MTNRALTALLIAAAVSGAATPLLAQSPERGPVVRQKTLKPAPWAQGAGGGQVLSDSERAAVESQNAWQTQQSLWSLMRQYPPAVGEILQRDPSLLEKADYMSAYPALTEFVKQHPEVARNPGFYFGSYQYRERTSRDAAYNLLEEMLAGMGVGLGLLGAASVFIWLVKTIVDHRRWLRTSKVQVEMHSKLLDRLTSNQELLAYAQSPAGSRFLESAPIALDADVRTAAPVSRIIWSMQAGVVLMALGAGLWFVQMGAIDEVREALRVVLAIAGSVGAGLLVSALAAYLVSSRLGLLPERKA
jgi:hypothetical protein